MNMNKTLFCFGSISLTELPDDMKVYLLEKCNDGYTFFVGDALGADKAIQKFLNDIMGNVIVHYNQGDRPRHYIKAINSSTFKTGGKTHIDKDRHMVQWCSSACGLWNMSSKGSKRNIEELKYLKKDITLFIKGE